MRPRQTAIIAAVALLIFCGYSLFRFERGSAPIPGSAYPHAQSGKTDAFYSSSAAAAAVAAAAAQQAPTTTPDDLVDIDAQQARKPKFIDSGAHPIWTLLTEAKRDFDSLRGRQSKSLEDAVREYRRRYGIPPPPHFDKWYEFAVNKGVQLIDEFDTIHEVLTPFWGLKPSTTRARAKEALGFGNALLAIQVRRGNITNMVGGGEWQRKATEGMMQPFLQYLPNMDLAFNMHDEPRVVVPHDDMSKLIYKAKNFAMPAANMNARPRNNFTAEPEGINEGRHLDEYKVTRFNVFPHQRTWTHSRMSCSPQSPARALEEEDRQDAVGSYGISELGFIYNETAMADICNSPSLSETYGFFDRPNAFNIVHDLFPIFSQSKISSFADILYPSPWYWYEKVAYDEDKDMEWDLKQDQLYWRGSTTGGFSRNGGWRRQHRQRFVQKINAPDQARVLENKGDTNHQNWATRQVSRNDYKDIIDVKFSHIGQCDAGDCDAQREFFTVTSMVNQQDAWSYKYLLDIDGNAFSGRFYAFLKSKSLVYKFAIFKEWHFEWLKPWAHYIPLSLQGEEWLEAVRFFGDSRTGGKEHAQRIALESREWADKALRKEDMEVWFFRLLLEYGRVIDDDRSNIGFSI